MMTMRTRLILVVVGLLLVLAVVNHSIWRNERLIATGQVVLLELAPVDPRSLMQGDYMRLAYAITPQVQLLRDADNRPLGSGYVILKLDANNIGQFVRTQPEATPLQAGETPLRYQLNAAGNIQIATDAYFFEEGRAPHFEQARYGEFRVAEDGRALLTGMRDETRSPL